MRLAGKIGIVVDADAAGVTEAGEEALARPLDAGVRSTRLAVPPPGFS